MAGNILKMNAIGRKRCAVFMAAAFAGLFLVAGSSKSQSQSTPPSPVRVAGDTMLLVGEIDPTMRQQFFAAISDNIKRVVIYSGGGDGENAIPIGREIWRRKLTLEVAGACMSACANFIFLAATHRVVDPDSLVGFHNTSSSGLKILGPHGNPNTVAYYTAAAAMEREFYRDLNIPEIYLYQPQIETGPSCYRYVPYAGRSDVKAPATDYILVSRYTVWIPPKEFLDKTGIAITGYWPATQAEMQRSYAKIFKPNAYILFGGHAVPMGGKELDAEYARVVQDTGTPQPGTTTELGRLFSQACIDAANAYTPLGLSASTPVDAPLRGQLEEVANAWLALFDRGNYDAAWEKSAFSHQTEVSKEQLLGMIHGVRDSAGPLISRRLLSATFGTKVSGERDTSYAILQFQAQYRNGKAVEVVNLKITDGAWEAAGYSMYPAQAKAAAH